MSLKDETMSRKEFSVAYSGSDRLANHSINVDTLAPALQAFGKLFEEANRKANGENADVKLSVISDFEHKCFNINFEIVLTFGEHVRPLIEVQSVKTAKEFLEWLGFLTAVVVADGSVVRDFLTFLRLRDGKKIQEVTKNIHNPRTSIVKIEGDNNAYTVNNLTLNLSDNPTALAAVKDMISPVGREGFETIEVRAGDSGIVTMLKDDTDRILASCLAGIEAVEDLDPDITISSAWLVVYAPVFDPDADKWRFRYEKEIVYVDVSETTIVQDTLLRGGVFMNDSYRVKLRIEMPRTIDGKSKRPIYKILEVLEFKPGPSNSFEISTIEMNLLGSDDDSDTK